MTDLKKLLSVLDGYRDYVSRHIVTKADCFIFGFYFGVVGTCCFIALALLIWEAIG